MKEFYYAFAAASSRWRIHTLRAVRVVPLEPLPFLGFSSPLLQPHSWVTQQDSRSPQVQVRYAKLRSTHRFPKKGRLFQTTHIEAQSLQRLIHHCLGLRKRQSEISEPSDCGIGGASVGVPSATSPDER